MHWLFHAFHDTLPIDNVRMPTEQRERGATSGELITKPIPEIGILLTRINEAFPFEQALGVNAAQLILEESRKYDMPYVGWELVRKKLAKELVGNIPNLPTTGAEGWAAGWEPERIVLTEAKAMQGAFDFLARDYNYERRRIHAIEDVLQGEFSDMQALRDTVDVFRGVRGRIRQQFNRKASQPELEYNGRFHGNTRQLIMDLPKIEYVLAPDGTFQQKYVLPKVRPQVLPFGATLPDSLSESYELLARLGIIGMPVLRTIIESPAIFLALHRGNGEYNFAFRGSRTKQLMTDDLMMRFLREFHIIERLDNDKDRPV